MPGMSLKPGMPLSERRSSSRISPASMFVSPSRSRMVVVICRLPNVGRSPKPVPEMPLSSIFSASDTSSSWWVRGVMSMFTPMFSYVERRDRLLGHAAGRNRSERRDGHRHLLAELRLCRHALGRAQLRVRQRPGVGVGLQQPVVQRRDTREEDTRLRQVPQIEQREVRPVDVRRAGDPFRPRARDLQAVLLELRPVDLEQLDVDDHLGARLVDRRDEPARGLHALGRVLDA